MATSTLMTVICIPGFAGGSVPASLVLLTTSNSASTEVIGVPPAAVCVPQPLSAEAS
jgi:hypothetical protein